MKAESIFKININNENTEYELCNSVEQFKQMIDITGLKNEIYFFSTPNGRIAIPSVILRNNIWTITQIN